MAATVRRKQFPRLLTTFGSFLAGQILFAHLFSTALRPQAVQPAHPPPAGSQQGRTGATLGYRKEKHHG
jgi:hypothetical protein